MGGSCFGTGGTGSGRRLVVSLAVAVAAVTAFVLPAAVPALGRVLPRPTAPWRATQLPVPTGSLKDGAAYAGPVSCPKVGGCVVLGEYPTPSGSNEDLIDTEASGVWSAMAAPLPRGGTEAANVGPFTLACTGVGDCVGTSIYETTTSVAPDLLEEVGGIWSAVAMPLPANASRYRFPTITSTACLMRWACVVVGDYVTTSGLSEGFVVTQKGRAVLVAETPTPGAVNHGSALSGVSCSAATSCVAVGYYISAARNRQPLAVSDAAGTLVASTLPQPKDAARNPLAELQAVSCARSAACVALGSYANAGGDRFGVVDTDSKGRWTTSKMLWPSGARAASPSPQVAAVACKLGNYCLAVGRYIDSSGKPQGLALREQAGRWSASMLPGTLDTGVVMRSVSCVSDTSCAAVGQYPITGGQVGYLLSLSGSTLSGSVAPAPVNASATPDETLGSIACPWVATCVASGTYEPPGSAETQLPFVVSN
ncbi:MAG: hypothetical protein ACLQNG_14605 [Acidimicrobiales bacterium]|jgi:hypothetical protein